MLIKAGMRRYIDRRGKEALLCPRGLGLVEVYSSSANRPAKSNGTGATCVILVRTR